MDWEELANQANEAVVNTLGRDVTYITVLGAERTIKGIVSKAYVQNRLGSTEEIKPVCHVRMSDLEAEPAKGDSLEIGDQEYAIIDTQEDGEGGVTLVLHER